MRLSLDRVALFWCLERGVGYCKALDLAVRQNPVFFGCLMLYDVVLMLPHCDLSAPLVNHATTMRYKAHLLKIRVNPQGDDAVRRGHRRDPTFSIAEAAPKGGRRWHSAATTAHSHSHAAGTASPA